MIRLVTAEKAREEKELPPKQELEEVVGEGKFFWLDLVAPSPAEVELLGEAFKFHTLSLEDCLRGSQRPKLEEYPHYLFLVLHTAEGQELNLFLGRSYLVTFHQKEIPFLAVLFRTYAEEARLRSRGTGFLLYQILRQLVDAYFPLFDSFEERLEEIEQKVFLAPQQKWLQAAFALRSELLRTRRRLAPQREVLGALLRRPWEYFGEEDHFYLADVHDHVLRLLELADNHHELIAALLEVYLTNISNRMTEIMKVLSIITTIMMPLSVIAGIYGMNFVYMPELRSPYGYPAVLGAMVLISIGMLIFFRRKGWL